MLELGGTENFKIERDNHVLALNYRSLLLTLGGSLLIANPLSAGSDDQRLDIYWIDVEGGAATLIVTPMGESMSIK